MFSTKHAGMVRRGAGALVVLALLATFGATAAAAAPFPQARVQSDTAFALKACQTLLDGTLVGGSKQYLSTRRLCATACGMEASLSRLNGRKKEDQASVAAARDLCAASCSFILEEGLYGTTVRGTQANGYRDPVSVAVKACWAVLASPTATTTLPIIADSGRSWR